MPDFNNNDTIKTLANGKIIRELDLSKLYRYAVKPNQNKEVLIMKLRSLPEVLYAGANYVFICKYP